MMWHRPFDMMYEWGDWNWFVPFHFVIPLLFWSLIIASVIFVFRRTRWSDTSLAGHRRTGLEVLEQRYARGEISRDEFLQKKADISG